MEVGVLHQFSFLCYRFSHGPVCDTPESPAIELTRAYLPDRLDWSVSIHLQYVQLSHWHYLGWYAISMGQLANSHADCVGRCGYHGYVVLGEIWSFAAFSQGLVVPEPCSYGSILVCSIAGPVGMRSLLFSLLAMYALVSNTAHRCSPICTTCPCTCSRFKVTVRPYQVSVSFPSLVVSCRHPSLLGD